MNDEPAKMPKEDPGMNLTAALKNEIFRPMTTLVVPGAIATGPYLLICNCEFQAVREFSTTYQVGYSIVVFVAILAAGLILEDIGGLIELGIDKILDNFQEGRNERWESYLKLQPPDQLIAQRYLRANVTRYYFELSAIPAFISFGVGLTWLNSIMEKPIWIPDKLRWVHCAIFLLLAYLLFEAFRSAWALDKQRKRVIESLQGVSSE